MARLLGFVFLSSLLLGCSSKEVGQTVPDSTSFIPRSDAAQRFPVGLIPWQASSGTETHRNIRPQTLMVAPAPLSDRRLAVIFAPADRQGLDIAIGGLDHPWSRESLIDTPLESIGDFRARGDSDGGLWVIVRERASPQTLRLFYRNASGALKEESIERPEGPSHPVDDHGDRCEDLAINVSPDGFLDIVFRQVNTDAQASVHHLRRPGSGGSFEHRVIQRDTDHHAYDTLTGAEREGRLGCHSLISYDESGFPEMITTEKIRELNSTTLSHARRGFMTDRNLEWTSSRMVHLADGRSQWAGPPGGGSVMGMDLGQHPYGLSMAGVTPHHGPIFTSSSDDRRLLAHVHALRVDTRQTTPSDERPGYFMPFGRWGEDLTVGVPYQIGDVSFLIPWGTAHVPDFLPTGPAVNHSVYTNQKTYGQAGQIESWEQPMTAKGWPGGGFRHPPIVGPFWIDESHPRRSPVFSRGFGWFAGICIDPDNFLLVCAGGQRTKGDPEFKDELGNADPPRIVASSIRPDGSQAVDEPLWIKLSGPLSQRSAEFYVVSIGPGPDLHGTFIGSTSSDGRILIPVPLHPYMAYQIVLLGQPSSIGFPWEHPQGATPMVHFWVPGEDGRFPFKDPRQDQLRSPCGESMDTQRDSDGICRRIPYVTPAPVEPGNVYQLTLPLNFDPDSLPEDPWLENQAGERLDIVQLEQPTGLDRQLGVWRFARWTERLQDLSDYTLVIPEGVHDGLGNAPHPDDLKLRFRTGATELKLTASTPEPGAENFPPRDPILLRFNADLDSAWANQNAIFLFRGEIGQGMEGELEPIFYDTSNPVNLTLARVAEATYALNHAGLVPNTTYMLRLTENVKAVRTQLFGSVDLNGAPVEITFTTGDTP